MNKLQQQIIQQWQTSNQKFKQLPPIVSFNLWYAGQNARDQKIIKAISAFVVLCLIVVVFVQPFLAKQDTYKARLNKSISTYESLANNAHKFSGAQSSSNSGPILSVVTQQAKQSGINLKRFEPDGDGLRIWLEDAVFDDAIRWLEELNQKHGVQIKQINVDRAEKSGRVDLRGTLFR